jgi:geranyl-CoA carboxylase alpha subunit
MALQDTPLLGVLSNRDYLRDIVAHEAFTGGDFSTGFIGQYFPTEKLATQKPSLRHVALAAVALYTVGASALAADHGLPAELLGWHSSHESPSRYRLRWREQSFELDVLVHGGHAFTVRHGEEQVEIEVVRPLEGGFHYLCEGVQARARVALDGNEVWLDADAAIHRYSDLSLAPAQAVAAGSDGRLLAHSDGKIVAVNVKPGDRVEKGQVLAVLEAMKMEFQLQLPVPGTVESVGVAAGQQVKNRQVLVVVKPE